MSEHYVCLALDKRQGTPFAQQVLDGEPMDHWAGEKLAKVRRGDVLWVVSIEKSRLHLVGRLLVSWTGDYQGAQRKLKNRDLWEAEHHVIAQRGTETPVVFRDIQRLAHRLRFNGAIARLPNRFDGRHLLSLRSLTPASVALLEAAHQRALGSPRPTFVDPGESGLDDEMRSFKEGESRERFVRHRRREREAREAKLRQALQRDGRLRCEVPGCGFDFFATYGQAGRDFAHVHHRKPLSQSSRNGVRTTLADLAVVCANCHAIIHRGGKCRRMETLIRRTR